MRANRIDRVERSNHCCLKCCITVVILIVALLAASLVGGYFAYGKFVEPKLGVGLFDVMKILSGLYNSDEKKIVTNPYSAEDRTAFYEGFENATYLTLPDDFTIAKLISGYFDFSGQENGSDSGDGSDKDVSFEGENEGDGLNDFTTGNGYIDSILKELKFDFSTLKGYNGGGSKLNITDKQFAAVINEVMTEAEIPQLKEIENTIGVPLKELIKVRQIDINKSTEEKKDVEMSLVIEVVLRDNVADILAKVSPDVPSIAATLAKPVIPKKIFVGATVYPYDAERQPSFFFNNISGEVYEDLLTLIKNVSSLTGGGFDIDATLLKVSETISKTIGTIEGYVGELNFVESGVSVDPIELIMKALKINTADTPAENRITSEDFLYMVKYIHGADNAMLDSANVDEYINNNVGSENRPTEGDFIALKANLSDAYGISGISEWTAVDFYKRYSEIPSSINIVDSRLYERTQAELKVKSFITDNALAYVLNGIIKSGDESVGVNLPVDINVEAYDMYKNGSENRMKIVAGIDTAGLIGGMISKESIIYNLVTSIIPKHLYIEIDVAEGAKEGSSSNVILNFIEGDNGAVATKEAFKTLSSIMGVFSPDIAAKLDIDNIVKTVEEYVNKFLDILKGKEEDNGTAPAAFAEDSGKTTLPNIEIVEGGISLPTVYEIIQHYSKSESGVIEIADIEDTFKHLYTVESIPSGTDWNITTDILDSGFVVRELENKLYIKNEADPDNDNKKPYRGDNLIEAISDMGTLISGGNITNIVNVNKLISDTQGGDKYDTLRMYLEGKELAALINSKVNFAEIAASLPYSDMRAVYAGSAEQGKLELIIGGHVSGEATGPMGIPYSNLLPNDVYVRAIVDFSGEYVTKVLINDIKENNKATVERILGGLTEKSGMFAEMEEKIKTELKNTLDGEEGSNGGITATVGKFSVSEDRINIEKNIYDILYDKSGFTEEDDISGGREIYALLSKMYDASSLGGSGFENAAANTGRFEETLRNGAYLKTENRAEDMKLTEWLSTISSSYKSNVDFARLVSEEEQAKDMRELDIKLYAEELAYLMSSEITVSLSGFEEPKIVRAEIEKTDGEGRVIAYLKAVKAKASPDDDDNANGFSEFMPNEIYIRAVITDVANVAEGEKRFKAEISFNALEYSDMPKVTAILNKFGAGVNIDDIADKSASTMQDTVTKIESGGFKLEYEPKSEDNAGSLGMGTIFDIVASAISNEDKTHTGETVRSAFYKLAGGESVDKMTDMNGNAIDIDAYNKDTDASDHFAFNTDGGLGVTMTDMYLAQILKEKIANTGVLTQFAIVTGEKLGFLKENYPVTLGESETNYIVATVSVSSDRIKSGDGEEVNAIVPNNVYVTLVMTVSGEIQFFMADMNADEMSVMTSFVNSEEMNKIRDDIKREIFELVIPVEVLGNTVNVTLGNVINSDATVYSTSDVENSVGKVTFAVAN